MKIERTIVFSMYGNLIVDSDTGAVLELIFDPDEHTDDPDSYLKDIERFDLAEYRRWDSTLPLERQGSDEIDIIYINYWNKDGEYSVCDLDERLRVENEPATV